MLFLWLGEIFFEHTQYVIYWKALFKSSEEYLFCQSCSHSWSRCVSYPHQIHRNWGPFSRSLGSECHPVLVGSSWRQWRVMAKSLGFEALVSTLTPPLALHVVGCTLWNYYFCWLKRCLNIGSFIHKVYLCEMVILITYKVGFNEIFLTVRLLASICHIGST